MTEKGIGAAIVRREDQRFITGKGRYTDDISQYGQAHAYFVRSPHAHARITGIDKAAAEAMPGVLAVLTGEDVKADGLGGLICGWMVKSKDGSPMKAGPHPLLAVDKVRYAGDPVAMIVAETYGQAKDAGEALQVDYAELDPVVAVGDAHDAGSLVHDEVANNLIFDWELGDKAATDAAFANAAHVTKIDLVNNRLVPNAMEPRAAVGHYDTGAEAYTCYVTSQNPHVHRLVMSAFIGVAPEHKLRVVAPDVGGGFGSKIFIYNEECLVTWASKKVGGRPVKWTSDRSEAFLTDAHGRDHVSHAELAIDAQGNTLGLRVNTKANLGAYMSTFSSSIPTYLYATLLAGQYKTPAIYCDVQAYYTNTVPVDAYRGAGRPEASFLLETLMDQAAIEIGMDPAEFRRRNFIATGSFPYQTPVALMYDIGNYEATLDEALKLADYAGFPARKAESERRGKLRGIGLSCYIEACGIAPSAVVGSLGAGVGLWESAKVRFTHTGKVQVFTGSHSHGQGHETTFAQVVAEKLGVALRGHRRHPWRHRQDPGRHGHLRLALAGGRRRGDRQCLQEAGRQGQEDRGASDGGGRGRHRVQGRPVQRRRHRQVGRHRPGRLHRLRAAQLPAGRRARVRGVGFLRSAELHLPFRLLRLRAGGRPRDRRGRDPALRRGRRFRQRRQPDDRRRPGPWRPRPGHRPGAARERDL